MKEKMCRNRKRKHSRMRNHKQRARRLRPVSQEVARKRCHDCGQEGAIHLVPIPALL